MGISFGNKGKPAAGGRGAGAATAAAPARIKAGAPKAASASLLPEDWVSGGLLNDVDVTIKDCTFVDDWTYNGAVADPVLALAVTFVTEDGTETVQHYSAGDLARWVPSQDGKSIEPAENSTAKALNNNTNCAAFIGSLMDAGFPKKLVASNSVAVFEGTSVHVNRVPQAKRSGLAEPGDGKNRDVLVVTKINAMPGETVADAPKPNGGARAAAPATRTPAPRAAATQVATEEVEAGDAVLESAVEAVASVLADRNGSVEVKILPLAIIKHLTGNPNKAEIIALIKNPDFLGAEGVPWSYDGTSLAAA